MENEKRLIDADALLTELDKFVNPMPDANGLHFLGGLSTAITEIENAPTIDAVPVVRCKDCEYCGHFDSLLYCDNSRGLAGSVSPEGFCSYGERREGE